MILKSEWVCTDKTNEFSTLVKTFCRVVQHSDHDIKVYVAFVSEELLWRKTIT